MSITSDIPDLPPPLPTSPVPNDDTPTGSTADLSNSPNKVRTPRFFTFVIFRHRVGKLCTYFVLMLGDGIL